MSPAVERVIAILRRDVPRPATLPVPRLGPRGLRFDPDIRCPMGLHAQADCRGPDRTKCLPVKGVRAGDVQAFAFWWDGQTDPAAAVAAVWGPA